jgi:hypothetical protein
MAETVPQCAGLGGLAAGLREIFNMKIKSSILFLFLTALASANVAAEEGENSFGSAADKAWTGVKSGSKEAWDGVSEGSKEAWEATKEESGKVWKATKKGAKEAVDSVGDAISGE